MIENYLTVEELEIIVSALQSVMARDDIWLAIDAAEDAKKNATLRESTLPCIKKALERAREDRAAMQQRVRRNAYDPNDPNDRHNPNHPNPRRDA